MFLAPGEGVEPPSLDSKSNVLPVALSRKNDYRIMEFIYGVCIYPHDNLKIIGQSVIGNDLVAEEGVEPPSLDYQSSALSLSYTAKEDRASYLVLCTLKVPIVRDPL